MKKVIFLAALMVLKTTAGQAQIATKSAKSQPKTTIQSPPVVVSVYSLTSVRVNIRTGNDNKEFPSKVDLLLINRGNGNIFHQPGENIRNEMKSNTNTEFGLEKYPSAIQENMTLGSIQKGGLALRIFYSPNFIADAWKIEGVSITLEFKDQNGNLHPTLGSKTIIFNNAAGFLDAANHILLCNMDGQFLPTTSSIQQ